MLVYDGIEPEAAIVALILNECTSPRQLPVADRYGGHRRRSRGLSKFLFCQILGPGDCIQSSTSFINSILLLQDSLVLVLVLVAVVMMITLVLM